jgi:hypothetical protein
MNSMGGRSLDRGRFGRIGRIIPYRIDRHGNRLQWSNCKKFDDTLAWMISHRSGDTCDP